MVKAYIITTAISFLSVILTLILAVMDAKKLGIKFEKGLMGSTIATFVKLVIVFSIPLVNIVSAIYLWFRYDEIVGEVKEER